MANQLGVRLFGIDEGQAALRDVVRSMSERAEAERIAYSVPGVTACVSGLVSSLRQLNIILRPPPFLPGSSATLAASELVGHGEPC